MTDLKPHDFWQAVHPPGTFPATGRCRDYYVADLADNGQLRLPIRPLSDGEHALASLIINQASFEVQDLLARKLADKLKAFEIDVVVGLPTLGLTLAGAVAQCLGHSRYVPLGTSRKFWYREELSVTLSSITTPEQQKRLYVDPRMLPLLEGKRVVLIDDVISSGASIVSGLQLLEACNIEPVVIGAAMLQSERWKVKMAGKWIERVVGVFSTPLLQKSNEDGSWEMP